MLSKSVFQQFTPLAQVVNAAIGGEVSRSDGRRQAVFPLVGRHSRPEGVRAVVRFKILVVDNRSSQRGFFANFQAPTVQSSGVSGEASSRISRVQVPSEFSPLNQSRR